MKDFSSLLYTNRRVLLIYKAFWERNILEESATEISYLFLYYDISVEFYHLSSPQSFKYLRLSILGRKHSIFYNTLPSIPVEEREKKSQQAWFHSLLTSSFLSSSIKWLLLFDKGSLLIYIKLDNIYCAHESIWYPVPHVLHTHKKNHL